MYFILSAHSHVPVDKTFATLPPSLLFSCDRVIIAYKISELDAFLLYFNKSTNPRNMSTSTCDGNAPAQEPLSLGSIDTGLVKHYSMLIIWFIYAQA